MKNKKAMWPIIAVVIIILIIIGLFLAKITGRSILGEDKDRDVLADKISTLNPLNLSSIDNYEHYKDFADRINTAILIISEQTGANIPKLKTTQESWSKASKFIIKYSPLIDNYNSMVTSAGYYQSNKTEGSYQLFYKELGVFSLEFTFISATIFHTATFNLVGGVFRSLGIGRLALKCPSCASAIMSSAYWTIKTTLVEKASEGADHIFDKLNNTFTRR